MDTITILKVVPGTREGGEPMSLKPVVLTMEYVAGLLEVMVLNTDDQPIEGVDVSIEGTEIRDITTVSGIAGLLGVVPGLHSFKCTKEPDYKPLFADILIELV